MSVKLLYFQPSLFPAHAARDEAARHEENKGVIEFPVELSVMCYECQTSLFPAILVPSPRSTRRGSQTRREQGGDRVPCGTVCNVL